MSGKNGRRGFDIHEAGANKRWQTVCMLSVVEDFNELKKYNVESILGSNQKNETPAAAAAADTTSTTKEAESTSEADKNAESSESS